MALYALNPTTGVLAIEIRINVRSARRGKNCARLLWKSQKPRKNGSTDKERRVTGRKGVECTITNCTPMTASD